MGQRPLPILGLAAKWMDFPYQIAAQKEKKSLGHPSVPRDREKGGLGH